MRQSSRSIHFWSVKMITTRNCHGNPSARHGQDRRRSRGGECGVGKVEVTRSLPTKPFLKQVSGAGVSRILPTPTYHVPTLMSNI